MSLQEKLQHAKSKERDLKESVRLAKEALQAAQERLLLQQGAIKMLEELLQSSSMSPDSIVGSALGASSVNNRRAKRSTKREMQIRKRAAIKILFENGDSTANDMLPEVNALLPYDLEINHLRNVLKKFTSDFKKGEDHGVWCLTDSARTNFVSNSSGYSDDDESSSS